MSRRLIAIIACFVAVFGLLYGVVALRSSNRDPAGSRGDVLPLRASPPADGVDSPAPVDPSNSPTEEITGVWHASAFTEDFRSELSLTLNPEGTGAIDSRVFADGEMESAQTIPVRWSVSDDHLTLESDGGIMNFTFGRRGGGLYIDLSQKLGFAVLFSRDVMQGEYLYFITGPSREASLRDMRWMGIRALGKPDSETP